ncbi:MAG TPA: hypothetical protein HA326_04085 [Thermoplasmata archaeon]|nr:hypothetical protein [Thermoplasmata archaeon]
MQSYTVHPAKSVKGEIAVPGDKSISHRSIMFGSIARGTTSVRGFLRGEDNFSTLNAFRAMGVAVADDGETLRIEGKGLHGLAEPFDILDCGNSGTSMRLMTGLLAGQRFFSVLTGDRYLRNRPMKRVLEPLSRMGAAIFGRAGGDRAPLAIVGKELTGIDFASPVASAQVKSALMLAGLYAAGTTTITEPHLSRDHSERMLRFFGGDIETFAGGVRVRGGRELEGRDIVVPGDISSAAFLIAAGLLGGREVVIEGVGTNPTRAGVLRVLRRMGAPLVAAPKGAARVLRIDEEPNPPHVFTPSQLYQLNAAIEDHVSTTEAPVAYAAGLQRLEEVHGRSDLEAWVRHVGSKCEARGGTLVLRGLPAEVISDLEAGLGVAGTQPGLQGMLESLANPIRRAIVSFVFSSGPVSYSAILKMNFVDSSSKLSFHLQKLQSDRLLTKTEGGAYILTDEGRQAWRVVRALGDERRRPPILFQPA